MGYTVEQFIRAALSGEWWRVELEPPVLTPEQHRRIVARALEAHGLDPYSDPEKLGEKEGMVFAWVPCMEGCAMRRGKLVMMGYIYCPRTRGASVNHERSHFHAVEQGYPEANEADCWSMAVEFCAPSGHRETPRIHLAQFIPHYLVRFLLDANAA
jgi:hypothetical protein